MDFDELALSLMRPLVRAYLSRRRVSIFRELDAAKTYISPERFIARLMLTTIITAVITIPLGLMLLANYAPRFIADVESVVSGSGSLNTLDVLGFAFGLLMLITPLIVYYFQRLMPRLTASDLGFYIESELPFFAAYVSIITQSNLSIVGALERMIKVKLLNNINKVIKEALFRNKALGEDPLTALLESSTNLSAPNFRSFIAGYVTGIRTGSDIVSYLQMRLREIVNDTLDKARRSADFLTTLMESYIGAGVILLIGLNVLYLAQAVSPTGSLTALQNAVSSNFLFGLFAMPAISLAFIYLGELSIYRVPYTDYRPYIAAGITALIDAIVLIIIYESLFNGNLASRIVIGPLQLDYAAVIALVLIASFTPISIYAERIIRTRRMLEKEFSEFLTDFAELSKSGFTPERAITILQSSRSYGTFDRYLREIAKEVKYGIPLRRILGSLMDRVRSFYVRAFTWLLLESIEYGGALPEVLETLSSFSVSMISINEDALSRLKPLRYVPYIGALMLILSLIIMVGTVIGLATTIFQIPQQMVNMVITSFALTTIIDSFLMGLVTGKLGEGELAAGFKHAVFITIIVLVLYLMSPVFIHMLASLSSAKVTYGSLFTICVAPPHLGQ